MPKKHTYLSAAIVDDFTLYAIHRIDGIVQYAGHISLWDATESQARTIAAGMCQGPIIGVEIERQDRMPGAKATRVATIGIGYADAQAR
jgi:hypothetical protein